MYLNLDLLYNIYFFLKIRVYKHENMVNVYTFNNHFIQTNHNYLFEIKGYIDRICEYTFHTISLHQELINDDCIEIKSFKIHKNLFYALITF